MDEQLEAKLAELKKLVKLPEGENPILSTADAFRLLEREDLIYRWEKRGALYVMRLSADKVTPVIRNEADVNMWIVNYVISMRQPVASLPVEPKPQGKSVGRKRTPSGKRTK